MFREAMNKLRRVPGTAELVLSPLYFSDPVGMDGGEFLNGVARIRTTLPPIALWQEIERIEVSLGRTDKGRKRPRTIDLDLLLYGECVVKTPQLCIPHAALAERSFVLRPLCDLAPQALVPPAGVTVAELWEQLAGKDNLRAVDGHNETESEQLKHALKVDHE